MVGRCMRVPAARAGAEPIADGVAPPAGRVTDVRTPNVAGSPRFLCSLLSRCIARPI